MRPAKTCCRAAGSAIDSVLYTGKLEQHSAGDAVHPDAALDVPEHTYNHSHLLICSKLSDRPSARMSIHSRSQHAHLVRFIHSRCQMAFKSPICPKRFE